MRRLLSTILCVGVWGCFDSRWTTGAEPQGAAARKLTPRLESPEPSPGRRLDELTLHDQAKTSIG